MYFQTNVVFDDKVQEVENQSKIKELLKEALLLLVNEQKIEKKTEGNVE